MYSQIASNKRRSLILVFGFVLFLTGFGYVLSRALGNSGLFPVIVVIAIIYALVSYFASSSVTLALAGAQPITKDQAPELYNIVENLAITAGLPMPKIYIVNDPSPNAFATGRDPQHAIVAVNSGILPLLDKSELEGVIAHELSHVGNYDIRLMGIVVVLVSVVALVSDLFLRFTFFGGEDEERNGNQLFVIIGLAGAILAPIAAILVQLAVSRKREYLADASGALLTRYPEGLASALAKIGAAPGSPKQTSSATAPLYFTNPLKGRKGLSSLVAGLFDTHPPIADRIARLNEMEGQA